MGKISKSGGSSPALEGAGPVPVPIPVEVPTPAEELAPAPEPEPVVVESPPDVAGTTGRERRSRRGRIDQVETPTEPEV